MSLLFVDVEVVHVGDFELAAAGRLQAANFLEDGFVIKVDADHGEIRFGSLGLFLNADHVIAANFGDAKAMRVVDFFQQNLRAAFLLS